MENAIVKTENMQREEWLNWRRKGIGGSDVGAIAGISKYKSPYAVYLDKIGELPDRGESEQAHFGNILEEIVAKEFTRVTGKKVRRKNIMLKHPEHEFMLANIDRAIVGERAFLECKTTSAYNSSLWEDDNIPETYMLQIQHYMAVLDYDYCYIACLIGGQKFVWKRIERDNDLVAAIITIEQNFWENNVLKRVPPLFTGGEADKKILSVLYPEGQGKEVPLPSSSLEIIETLNKLKEEKKILEAEIDNCENALKNMLQEAEIGTIQDKVITWKNVVTHRVDSKRLKEKYPEIYNECLNETSSRKFTIKERKDK